MKEGGLGDVLFFYLPRFSARMTELQREVRRGAWLRDEGLDTSVPDLATSVKIRPSKPTGPASVLSLSGSLVLSLSSLNKPPLHENFRRESKFLLSIYIITCNTVVTL